LQQGDQALPIIRVGRGDPDRHNQPEGIDQNMPFAAFDF
jgi:hypothetical protein